MLALANAQMSVLLQAPELALTDEQNAALAKATANVARWYVPKDALESDTKTGAWVSLFIVLIVVYGSPMMMIARRRAQAVKELQEAQKTNG